MEVLGIALQLVSSGSASLGYILQKAHHVQNGLIADAAKRTPVHRSWRWLSGLLCMVVSAGAAVGSAPLLNASVQATLGAATIVFNGVLAWLILGDELLVLDAIAILVIVLGTVVAMAGAEPSASYTFEQTLALLEDPLVYAFVGITWPLAALGVYAVEKTAAQPRESWVPAQATFMSIVPPVLGGFCNNHVLYAVKVVTTAIAGGEWAAFRSATMYLYIAVQTAAVVGQVRWLNTGLLFFPPSAIVPVFQVTIILGGSLAGIVYYHDLRSAPPGTIAAFACGAAICSLGIVLIQLKGARVAAFDKARADAAAAAAAAAGGSGSAPSSSASDEDDDGGARLSADSPVAVRNPLAGAQAHGGPPSRAGGAGDATPPDSHSGGSRGQRISAMSSGGGAAAAGGGGSRLGGGSASDAAPATPPLEQPLIAAADGGLAAARNRSAATAAGPRSRGGSKVAPSPTAAGGATGGGGGDGPSPPLRRRWFDLSLSEAASAVVAARPRRSPEWR
jgi:uncharacterized membrane protein YgcG